MILNWKAIAEIEIMFENEKQTKAMLDALAPEIKNWIPNIVFPEPGPPTRRIHLPRGNPPPSKSSNPLIPDSILSIALIPYNTYPI